MKKNICISSFCASIVNEIIWSCFIHNKSIRSIAKTDEESLTSTGLETILVFWRKKFSRAFTRKCSILSLIYLYESAVVIVFKT